MNLLPKDIYEKLEFDKVLALLQQECSGEMGQAYFENLQPETDLKSIEIKLKQTKELKLVLEKNDKFPFATYYPIDEDLRFLAIEGYVLSVESLQRLNAILLIFRDLYRFFSPVRREIYPNLFDIIRHTNYDNDLSKEITRVIDDDGNIRSDASPELVRIRKATQSKMREMDAVYRKLIGEFRQKGWLADNNETLRNGRRVLAVPVEHKRKIRGIIHDESTTGRTAYIEPEAAIDVNNDIFDLEQEEKQEIYRILRDLSAKLRPYCPQLADYQAVVFAYDIVLAKARLAFKMKAFMPQLVNAPHFGIRKGRHPLLYLKNKAAGKETVPFNLELFKDNRILLVSGPNAGGKSVLMKSVGLLQVMLQSGLLVPVHELSEMGVFESIFAHIGDSQSLEDDLSTYSSHLQNMKAFLKMANEHTLVLIDEFGSGTDPKIGGAIAEAILRGLNEKKVMGVITTHYGNLKMFAYRNQGIVNGCMNFDRDNLKPTYKMTIGRPGSSYAFEIATSVGLDKEVLKYAKKRIGENEQAVDELLVDLQNEKQEYDDKLKELSEKQSLLEKLIKQYDDQIKDVEFRRKKLKLDAKEFELQKTANANHEVQRLLKELKQTQNLEQTKKLVHSIREEQQKLANEVTQLNDDVYHSTPSVEKPIEVGLLVKMRSGNATGRIESLDKKEAMVLMGDMRVKVKIKDLVAVGEPLTAAFSPTTKHDSINRSANFDAKTDLRGLSMVEADRILEAFLDNAVVSSANTLSIVHGKGNGVLRKLVRQKLKEYKSVKRAFHPENAEGGDGVTIVEL
ncbi:MAG: endonuclease MutS2 [Saprospiraceae bacterium]|nr:endonuclease MutS2 [Saprospiraceae bacterium]